MKQRNRSEKTEKRDIAKEKKSKNIGTDEDSENQGFGDWLKSGDGVEMMRLFVIANSLLVFLTMGWPNMQRVYSIIRDYVMGEED